MAPRRILRSLRESAFISAALLVVFSGAICISRTPSKPPDGGGPSYTELSSDITADTTLPAGYYDVTGILSITAGLTLQPGTTLRFQAGSGLVFDSTGHLDARGTADAPILLTGATASRGFWNGIRFLGGSASNVLEHVTIEYAGQTDGGGLSLLGDSAPVSASISHCVLQNGAGYGLVASGNVDLTGFAANTLTQNVQGPCRLPPNSVRYLDTASTYQGNDADLIVLSEGTVTGDEQIWPDLDADYLASNIQVAGNLTLLPGATLVFASGGVMNVQSTGSLRAVGAPGRGITLTGATQTPGFWQGLSYTNTIAAGNSLTLVTIEYGGAGGGGNLNLNTPPVAVQTSSCTFAHSANCGVFVAPGGTFGSNVEAPDTFIDNPGGDVCP